MEIIFFSTECSTNSVPEVKGHLCQSKICKFDGSICINQYICTFNIPSIRRENS